MPGTLTNYGLTPRVTEWVPELLAEIHAYTERTIRTHTTSRDPWHASSTLLTNTLPGWQDPERAIRVALCRYRIGRQSTGVITKL